MCGKGTKVVLVPLPSAVSRAIYRAMGARTRGPILLNTRGARMDRHAGPGACAGSPKNAAIHITRALHTCSATCLSRPVCKLCDTDAMAYTVSPADFLVHQFNCEGRLALLPGEV